MSNLVYLKTLHITYTDLNQYENPKLFLADLKLSFVSLLLLLLALKSLEKESEEHG